MPQSLTRIYIHTVFSTKDRVPIISTPVHRTELHRYLGAISRTLGSDPLRVGGTADHVHLLTNLTRSMSLSDYLKELKRVSSRWVKERWRGYNGFAWQRGYGCFSVGEKDVEQVVEYIDGQDDHHREVDFKAEFRALLSEHNIEYDERYVWD